MKNKRIMDPDMEVICLVNSGVDGRQRVAENRALLDRMARKQAHSRKAAWWRGFRSMVIEAGAFAGSGVAILIAMGRELVDPLVGVPLFVVCLIWTAIRIDRFVRR